MKPNENTGVNLYFWFVYEDWLRIRHETRWEYRSKICIFDLFMKIEYQLDISTNENTGDHVSMLVNQNYCLIEFRNEFEDNW